MKATQLLHNPGQSIWFDNITRDLLTSGTLQHYISSNELMGVIFSRCDAIIKTVSRSHSL